MATRRVRLLGGLGLASLAVLSLTACPEDAQEIVEVKATSLDFPVSALGAIDFPVGPLGVERLALAAFDTTVADAFGSSIPGTRGDYTATGGAGFGGGWNFAGYDRNSTTDPRLPALVDDDASVTPNAGGFGIVILDPSGVCGSPCPFHNPFAAGSIDNLEPNTEYVVALFRYELQVNGQLDAGLAGQGLAIDAADQLAPVGGTPQGDPTIPIVTFPTIVPLLPAANPMVLGNFTTNAQGSGGFDVVLSGPGMLYQDISADPPDAAFDSSLVARDDNTQTTFPRYNYLVILEGPAIDAADAADNDQVLRVQIGQDFAAATGEPINNGFAPFPTPMTVAELVAAPGGAGAPDSISIELSNIPPLAGNGQYQVWLFNREESATTTVTSAVGTYEKIAILRQINDLTGEIESETDSVIETTPDQSGFVGQLTVDLPDVPLRQDPAEVKHRLVISDATVSDPDSRIRFFTDVLITVESGGQATSPSDVRPLWFQVTDQGGTPNNFFDDVSAGGSLQFGHFDTSDPAASRVLAATEYAQSFGTGGVLTDGVQAQEISVDIRNLPLPPRGFYYSGWLQSSATGATLAMGPVTSLAPDTVSLINADVDPDLPGVTATGIRFANARVALDADDLIQGGQANFDLFFLTLEPKAGGEVKSATDLDIGLLPVATIIDRMGGN